MALVKPKDLNREAKPDTLTFIALMGCKTKGFLKNGLISCERTYLVKKKKGAKATRDHKLLQEEEEIRAGRVLR